MGARCRKCDRDLSGGGKTFTSLCEEVCDPAGEINEINWVVVQLSRKDNRFEQIVGVYRNRYIAVAMADDRDTLDHELGYDDFSYIVEEVTNSPAPSEAATDKAWEG